MGTGRVLALTLGALSLAGAALAAPAIAQSRINPFAQDLLEEHNRARDQVGVPRLSWSRDLAQDAQAWADHLAKRGSMAHADRTQRNGRGENLWMGAAGHYGADVMVGMFVDEKKHYRHDAFPNVSHTGAWRDVGHYTQVVWRETKEVGCAVARGRTDDFLVCRYWPAGNIYGRMAY